MRLYVPLILHWFAISPAAACGKEREYERIRLTFMGWEVVPSVAHGRCSTGNLGSVLCW